MNLFSLHLSGSQIHYYSDNHAFLGTLEPSVDLIAHRTKFYQLLFKAIFASLGIIASPKLHFIKSTHRFTPEYHLDLYKILAMTTEQEAQSAAAEVTKQAEHASLGHLIQPGLQSLDEQYLGADFQFGGLDQVISQIILSRTPVKLPLPSFYSAASSHTPKSFSLDSVTLNGPT